MKLQTYWIHDQFSLSPDNKESLSVVCSNGKTLAIDCPSHTLKSLHRDTQLISTSTLSKIDYLFVSHTDSDHIGWIPQLLWMKKFWEKQKLNLVTHPQIYEDLWNILKHSGFRQERTSDTLKYNNFLDYVNFSQLEYGKEIILPWFWKIRSFYRSTKHCPGMDVIAIQVFDLEGNNIANFSSDTGYDPELIEFLYSEEWKVIHECWAYGNWNFAHSDIDSLINGIDENHQIRTFINHIPETKQWDILEKIKSSWSPIRFADVYSTVPQKIHQVIKKPEIVFPGSFDPWTYWHQKVVTDYLDAHPFSIVDIVIAINPAKKYMFTPEQRKLLIEQSFPNKYKDLIKVSMYDWVIADYVYENKKSGILKWIRNSKDFEYESDIISATKHFTWDPVNIFIPQTQWATSSISSSMLKEIMRLSWESSGFTPAHIREAIRIKQDNVMLIWVTWSIASWKSTLCKELSKHTHIHHIDLDSLSNEIHTNSHTRAFIETRKVLAQEFWEDILLPDGTTNKKILGEKVFQDSKNLDTLTNIMTEPTMYLLRKKISEVAHGWVILIESAILMERNISHLFDENIINIQIPEKEQRKRLFERNDFNEAQIDKRLASQFTNIKRSDAILQAQKSEFERLYIRVVWNNYNSKEVEKEILERYETIKRNYS